MAVLKEWKCAEHGSFDGTHPICPSPGCFSENVEREFRTPPSIGTGKLKAFDAGIRRTAEGLGIRNFRTAYREGDVSFAGRSVDNTTPIGKELLWGRDVERVMGAPMAQQIAAAQAPLTVPNKDPAKDPYLRVNSGMRSAATTIGLTQRALPPAEITGSLTDKGASK